MWGPDYGDQVDYLRVFIKNLRKKIEPNPEHPQYITTEPWVGYRFNGRLNQSRTLSYAKQVPRSLAESCLRIL